VPGTFLGERLDQAPEAVEAVMLAPAPVAERAPVPEALLLARDHFRERQGLIEADLVQSIGTETIHPAHLALANRELANNIAAALALGDMDYLGTDLDWLTGLLGNRDLPVAALGEYLALYTRAAEQHMDRRAQPIIRWLDEVVHHNGLGRMEKES
jgi:hypothetical protein